MKKLLMGTTSIAGAVAILGGAAAMAAEAPTLTIKGHSRFAVYMVDQQVRNTQGKGYKFSSENTEIHFNLRGQADNGLRYSLKVEMDARAGVAENADEMVIRLQGDWGIVDLGDEDGVEDLMTYGGENLVAGRGAFDGAIGRAFNFGAAVPGGTVNKRNSPDLVGDTGDATKISYYTPRMEGFQAGVSFTPNAQQSGDAAIATRDDIGVQNHWALGLNYQQTFSEVGVNLAGVYYWAEAKPGAAGGVSREDVRAWAVGGWLSYAGFRAGGGYGDSGDSLQETVSPDYSDDTFWNVAADYTAGPWRASVSYFQGIGESAVAGVADDKTRITSAGVTYTIAPGLNAFGEVSYVRSTTGRSNGADNKGKVGIIGTNISF